MKSLTIIEDEIPMDIEEEKFRTLLHKYNEGSCTAEEIAWLESWYLQWNELKKETLSRTELDEEGAQVWEVVCAATAEKQPFKLWPRIAAAAAVLIVVGTGVFFYNGRDKNDAHLFAHHVTYKNDVKPGSIKATLTLADGSKIVLDGAKNGALAKQTGITITKAADGQLIYTVADSKSANPSGYNTIETPRGGQYQIRLPDGSQVWLNAASAVKFPVSFENNTERRVELSGEAYFEVAHNKLKPFIVKTAQQEVQVLGTHFDVNSYPDNPVAKTTLLEGSVKLNGSTMLKPGEQGQSKGGNITVKAVNTEEVMDWKNKQFVLDEEDLQSVMRRIARWYDVEVVYEGTPQEVKFVGVVSSTRNISGVLKLMERTGKVHFKVEGNKITVLNRP